MTGLLAGAVNAGNQIAPEILRQINGQQGGNGGQQQGGGGGGFNINVNPPNGGYGGPYKNNNPYILYNQDGGSGIDPYYFGGNNQSMMNF